ncbi:MAG: hypothetical protein LAN62_01060, partial [Acidobacteriia bacterium]|nr:hypothetical protein [Terriglobia bacterium]
MDVITRRRSDRILVPLRIRVTGVDAAWDPFEEDAVTISVNKHGACISLQHVLLPEDRSNALGCVHAVLDARLRGDG